MAFFLKPKLILKLLVLFPAAWIVFVLLVELQDKGQVPKENDARKVFKLPDIESNDIVKPVATVNPAPEHLIHDAIKPGVKSLDSEIEILRHQQAQKRQAYGGVREVDSKAVLLPPKDVDGPGEMGKAFVLPANQTGDLKKLVDDGWQKNAFNQYASDMISIHRSLPDMRDDE